MMDGAIKIEKSKNINFRNCTFSNIGITGLLIEQGSSDINISKCKFYDIGANAIHIAGQLRKSDTTIHNITIADCTIQKYGQVYNSGCGILLRYAYDCEIIHNEISEGYYTGISAGWSWGYTKQPTSNIHIAYNHIHDIKGGFLSDGAGIYTLGQQEGTVIEYNHIHDIVPHCLGNGIYLDEGSSYILVRNNLVYNANQGCFYQHYGNENTVENNIFAACLPRSGFTYIEGLKAHIKRRGIFCQLEISCQRICKQRISNLGLLLLSPLFLILIISVLFRMYK
jgi:parallel beta-helix repeat protein